MTNPTTAECIEHLDTAIKAFDWAQENLSPDKEDFKTNAIIETIRAKLIAADEMAKATESALKQFDLGDAMPGSPVDKMRKALAAWREAGGE